MTIQDRLKMIIKMHNLTASSFADKIGVQRSSLSHIMAGRNKPSMDFIEKTLKSFPRVNANWLLTGKQEVVTEHEQLTRDDHDKTKLETKSIKPEVKIAEQNRKIEKIIVFYSDGTYEITLPIV